MEIITEAPAKGRRVAYSCMRCGDDFLTPQFSHRRYCVRCEAELERDGWKKRKSRKAQPTTTPAV